LLDDAKMTTLGTRVKNGGSSGIFRKLNLQSWLA